MKVSHAARQRMHDEGYLVLRQAVPADWVAEALHRINHSLGALGMAPDELPTLRAQSYCPALRGEPRLTRMFNDGPLSAALTELLGAGNVQEAAHCQLALRFPKAPDAEPTPPRGHLDGLGTGLNGIDKGGYTRGFTALAVIYLSAVPTPYAGNFTVWPGSHRVYAEHFRRHGHAMLAEGLPAVDLPADAVQVTGEPGDVVLAHHMIMHGAAPNHAPHIRYAAIFRVRHREVEAIGLDAFTDPWREWPGVREAVGAGA